MTVPIWNRQGSLAEKFWTNGKADFPIYDMHAHMGPHYAIYMKRSSPETMVAHVKRIGVARMVFSHHEALWGEMRTEEVVEICRRFPDILRMYVTIVPQRPEYIREDLAKFDSWAPYAVGFKTLADYHGIPLDDSSYDYAYRFAEERGIPVLNHTWGGSRFDGGQVVMNVLRKFPKLKFICGHSIFAEWNALEQIAAEGFENIWMELTAIPGQRGMIERLVSLFGSKRILYGTDMPWFDEYQAVGGVLSAHISEEAMRDIFYRNARRLLGESN